MINIGGLITDINILEI